MPLAPSLASQPVKALLMADSGFGKTGACAALSNAGYTCVHFDFDNGARVLLPYLTEEAKARHWVRTHTDKISSDGLNLKPDGVPTAWSNLVADLKGFTDTDAEGNEVKFPAITEWPSDYVAIFDSLTMLSMAAMRYRLRINIGFSDSDESLSRWMHPYPADYGEAQNLIQNLLDMLYGSAVQCNVLVLTHVRYVGGGGVQTIVDKKTGGITRREIDSEAEGQAQPTAIGRAIGSLIPRYFNTVLSGEKEGSGMSEERVLVVRGLERFPLKIENPNIPSRLPISTGLADLFKSIQNL